MNKIIILFILFLGCVSDIQGKVCVNESCSLTLKKCESACIKNGKCKNECLIYCFKVKKYSLQLFECIEKSASCNETECCFKE